MLPPVIPVDATPAWHAAHPGALIGLLEIASVDNRIAAPALDVRKREVELTLRERPGGRTELSSPPCPFSSSTSATTSVSRRRITSFCSLSRWRARASAFRRSPPLVDANFVAELQTLVQTAGHDAAKLRPPLAIDVFRAGDTMTQMNGTSKTLPAGDMVMRGAEGICCSILYGQDDRSPISDATTHALYVAYAPAGVGEASVRWHLDECLENIRRFAPACSVEELQILPVA